MLIIFRASHRHWHMRVYLTRKFWGLKHPPNLNWKEWTVLLADLTSACIRVKPVTSVITHTLLPFIPVTPIKPEKCGPDFISLLYYQGNHILSSQTFTLCKFTLKQRYYSGSRPKKIPGPILFGGTHIHHDGLGYLPRLMGVTEKVNNSFAWKLSV